MSARQLQEFVDCTRFVTTLLEHTCVPVWMASMLQIQHYHLEGKTHAQVPFNTVQPCLSLWCTYVSFMQTARCVHWLLWVCCQLLSVDIDECLDNVCGDNGTCTNTVGLFACDCQEGYYAVMDATPVCQGGCYTTHAIVCYAIKVRHNILC